MLIFHRKSIKEIRFTLNLNFQSSMRSRDLRKLCTVGPVTSHSLGREKLSLLRAYIGKRGRCAKIKSKARKMPEMGKEKKSRNTQKFPKN